ncbi:metallophosphoesterase [Paracholeplasma manati]|uniref:metallophosphoesterase n=1 Tax=Paracholeplasma manati TaxID=591373 RepID=UPI0024077D99|nr:metallophosphoesterase [Paracholeplasma manati]MDG0888321.1 metallophosphoesterase [Paracholeplasma manati]
MNDIIQKPAKNDLEVLEFFKFGVRQFNELLTDEKVDSEIDLFQIELIRDSFYDAQYILELFLNDRDTLENNALKKSKIIKGEVKSVIEFLKDALSSGLIIKPSNEILNVLVKDSHYYFLQALNIIKNHPLFIIHDDNQVEINQVALLVISENHPIHKIINSNPQLVKLNRQRTRNFVIFDNSNHQVIFDLYDSEVKLIPKTPFSDFEHDTNRTFAEKVITELLFDFDNRKNHFIRLLSKKKSLYQREIDILKGFYSPSKEEVLVLLSVLGRLQQENNMGPFVTFREEKLKPHLIADHKTTLNYINCTIDTLTEFRNDLLNYHDIDLIPFGKFELLKKSNEIIEPVQPRFLLELVDGKLPDRKTPISTNYRRGNVESPNYLESFFRKIVNLPNFVHLIPFFDYNNIQDLTKFSKRHKGPVDQKEFMIAAKMRSILMDTDNEYIKASIHQVLVESKPNTYSQRVSEYLTKFEGDMIKEFYRFFFIFNQHVETEIANFVHGKHDDEFSSFNNSYLSIASDMHLNSFTGYEASNYSNQFNIIAGDFADNLFHRGNVTLSGTMPILGVGVLGNHDVFIENNPSRDLRKEIKTNYQLSIESINRHFPNIKILNDEVIYKDGYAIIGMTLVYDENNGVRTFFANEDWGKMFSQDNYIARAKFLLNQVDQNIPIIFISHSPFKEYSVCSNKQIGVPSDWVFKDYPNVKMYIHGHGHSKTMKKKINNILCITNPVIFPDSIFEMSFTKEEVYKILGIREKTLIDVLKK